MIPYVLLWNPVPQPRDLLFEFVANSILEISKPCSSEHAFRTHKKRLFSEFEGSFDVFCEENIASQPIFCSVDFGG